MREHGFHHHRGHVLHFLLMIVGGLAIFSLGVMLLWNWLLPTLFGLPQIDFLQAIGLLVLSRLLFGGLGHAHALMHMGHGGDFRNRMRERWEQMTPEQREQFHERFHGGRGHGRGCGKHGPEGRERQSETIPTEQAENHG